VDANAYFSRPGPRLADGVALLAHLIHPELFPSFPSGAFQRFEPKAGGPVYRE
jgi:iron complex transport system substrate-binding protein